MKSRTRSRPPIVKTFEDWIRTNRCAVTGESGVETHHVHGPRSLLTGQRLPRRKGAAEMACIPLSPEKHRLVHQLGEPVFGVQYFGGETACADLALTYLATWVLEGRANG